jgi:apolipoprotein D and lipocalin family protein
MAVCCAWGVAQTAPVQAADPQPPTVVESVEIGRYLGLWHEIARIPNRFQRSCAGGTTAQYSLRADGRIDVVNRCRTREGGVIAAHGIAKIADRQTRAKLKVSFVNLLGIRLFWGDYWIIGLDDEYRWAVVGHPQRKYGWILSRTPQLPPETLEEIFSLLERQGYDPGAFILTEP